MTLRDEHRGVVLLIVIGVLLLSTRAAADTIGPTNCNTCNGASYSLTYSYVSQGVAADVVNITLTIDTSTVTAASLGLSSTQYANLQPIRIDQVAVKVSSSILSATLLAAPGGASSWALGGGGINSAGCSGSGSGFECANAISLTGAPIVPNGSLLVWVFQLTIPHGSLSTAANGSSIKARYVDKNGNKVGSLVSEYTTLSPTPVPVPEPATIGLLITGISWMAFRHRSRTTS